MRIKVVNITDSLVIFDRIWTDSTTIRFSCNRDAFPENTLPEDDFYFVEHNIFHQCRNNIMIGYLCLRWSNIKESVKRI